jgi:hypothetical protein
VRVVGGTQDLGAPLPLTRGQTVVDVVRSHEAKGAVPMLGVVPGEEPLAERLGVLVGAEPGREVRPVLEGLELGLGEGVVVRDLRPAVRGDHAEGGQQQGHGLGCHRGAAVGVNGELIGCDVLALATLGDQDLGQRGRFLASQQPADDVAAKDVEQHVEVVVRPLDGAQELGDVPAPDLVRPGGEQFRLPIRRVPELVAPLAHLRVRGQHPVHRADRARRHLARVEQLRPDLRRRQVDEPVPMEQGQDLLAISRREGVPRGAPRPRGRDSWRRAAPPPVERGPSQPQGVAQRGDAHPSVALLDHGNHDCALIPGRPSSAAKFFWASTSASARSARPVICASCRSSSAIFRS